MLTHLVPSFSKLVAATVIGNMIAKSEHLAIWEGKEFDNEQFRQYFKEKGIIHEYSAPYTAEQNGRIERENRSIVEGARTMLLVANLQTGLWAEAVNASIYTLNRRPRELDKKVPYELWSGKTVTLNHLRKFGAEVYIHVPKQFRSKFESKSKKMILVMIKIAQITEYSTQKHQRSL